MNRVMHLKYMEALKRLVQEVGGIPIPMIELKLM